MAPPASQTWVNSAPLWLGFSSGRLLEALGSELQLRRAADHSPAPIVLCDEDRGFREANAAARLALRLPLERLRRLQIDDVTATDHIPTMFADWDRLTHTGFAASRHEVSLPDGGRFGVSYHALAGAAPGVHLIAFAPADWPDDELITDADLSVVMASTNPTGLKAPLTRREREILGLAANGATDQTISELMWVGLSTIRSDFDEILDKLGVPDRAAAVARSMRLGLID